MRISQRESCEDRVELQESMAGNWRPRSESPHDGWLAKHGADPMSMTQPEFARFVLSESESAARIIETAGIKPQ
jgi:hypothetical protein